MHVFDGKKLNFIFCHFLIFGHFGKLLAVIQTLFSTPRAVSSSQKGIGSQVELIWIKAHPHWRQIRIHPVLSGRIATHFNGNSFAKFGTNANSSPVWMGLNEA